jgi:PAS domain S-box-containing protein
LPLIIGIAFGLFGASHFIKLFMNQSNVDIPITIIRLLAYILIIVALAKILSKSQKNKSVLEEKVRFQLLFATNPDAVILSILEDGIVVDINDSFKSILGYSRETVIGKSVKDLGIWKNPEQRDSLVENLKESTFITNIEAEFYKSNHELITGIVSSSMVNIQGTNYVISVIKDITCRKKLEEELQRREIELKEANATKDRFFSILAHDLRNPLGSFQITSELLYDNYDSFLEEERKEFIGNIKDSSKQVFSLLENLLQWSRTQRGTLEYTPSSIDLATVAENCMQVLRLTAQNKSIELINSIAFNTMVFADENLLTTIIRNLCSNALKFTPAGGTVEIGATDTDKHFLQIFVKDSGIGMSEDLLSDLFKIDKNTKRLGTSGEPSAGLGLILCKEFVEKHGGKIWAESEEGKGSVFKFTLRILSDNLAED